MASPARRMTTRSLSKHGQGDLNALVNAVRSASQLARDSVKIATKAGKVQAEAPPKGSLSAASMVSACAAASAIVSAKHSAHSMASIHSSKSAKSSRSTGQSGSVSKKSSKKSVKRRKKGKKRDDDDEKEKEPPLPPSKIVCKFCSIMCGGRCQTSREQFTRKKEKELEESETPKKKKKPVQRQDDDDDEPWPVPVPLCREWGIVGKAPACRVGIVGGTTTHQWAQSICYNNKFLGPHFDLRFNVQAGAGMDRLKDFDNIPNCHILIVDFGAEDIDKLFPRTQAINLAEDVFDMVMTALHYNEIAYAILLSAIPIKEMPNSPNEKGGLESPHFENRIREFNCQLADLCHQNRGYTHFWPHNPMKGRPLRLTPDLRFATDAMLKQYSENIKMAILQKGIRAITPYRRA